MMRDTCCHRAIILSSMLCFIIVTLPTDVSSFCIDGTTRGSICHRPGIYRHRKSNRIFRLTAGRNTFAEAPEQSVSLLQQPQDLKAPSSWYPRTDVDCDFVEAQGIILAAKLVKRQQLQSTSQDASKIPRQVSGRFRDLTCEQEGEHKLESLFADYESLMLLDDTAETCKLLNFQNDVLAAAVMVFQSLLVLATQVGLTGHPDKLRKLVAHLDDRFDSSLAIRDLDTWDSDSIRRLKYRIDRAPAMGLLGELMYKRSPQGAFDLLFALGIFSKHEDLPLLRSGFRLRFSEAELQDAEDAVGNPKEDVDTVLGLRLDLRHLKVFTIDSASTLEVDDGVSVEMIEQDGGAERYRYWIHIADGERHVTAKVWDTIARARFTSLYLPTGSYPMLPPSLSSQVMSLNAGQDSCALSMGIELNGDGSINPSSVILTPSLIRVDYRLTYDEADEMLSEGVAYQEEWELGTLFDMARRRREYRIKNGSIEGIIRKPIPVSAVTVFDDNVSPDGIGISVSVEVSHNAGRNHTVVSETDGARDEYSPVSSATVLVTESMILAGEGIGVWKANFDTRQAVAGEDCHPNIIRLPFRTQPSPDFRSRAREHRIWMDLLKYNSGGGYCHTWYSRRFMQSLKISEEPRPHSGLGLQSYVQWTSPIRRYSDLQTHRTIKRCLRRQRIFELISQGRPVPVQLQDCDAGFPAGTLQGGKVLNLLSQDDLDTDSNPLEGLGLQGAARTLQRQTQQYWLFEYLRRLSSEQPDRLFMAVVLGSVDPERRRYAIFVEELGLEHRYTSPAAYLDPGTKLRLRIDDVNPRFGVLHFVQEV